MAAASLQDNDHWHEHVNAAFKKNKVTVNFPSNIPALWLGCFFITETGDFLF
jgi:hypothetical protein